MLIPDFEGNWPALQEVIEARPEILGHNVESVPRIYYKVRPQARYHRSLELLRRCKQQGLTTKTGIMLGIGEREEEIESAMDDLVANGVDILTLGQYLQPTQKHLPVDRWVTPDEFKHWKTVGEAKGLRHVESGPLVRSSYHAEKQVHAHAAV
ncbi:MAG: lipoyl synthase [Tepidisphaeraceae bacterium]